MCSKVKCRNMDFISLCVIQQFFISFHVEVGSLGWNFFAQRFTKSRKHLTCLVCHAIAPPYVLFPFGIRGTSVWKEILNEAYCFLLCKYEGKASFSSIEYIIHFFGAAACSTITTHVYLMLTSLNWDDPKREQKTVTVDERENFCHIFIYLLSIFHPNTNDIKFHRRVRVKCDFKRFSNTHKYLISKVPSFSFI